MLDVNRKVYYIETKDAIYWSERKIDVEYEHVERTQERPKFRETNEVVFRTITRKPKVKLPCG